MSTRSSLNQTPLSGSIMSSLSSQSSNSFNTNLKSAAPFSTGTTSSSGSFNASVRVPLSPQQTPAPEIISGTGNGSGSKGSLTPVFGGSQKGTMTPVARGQTPGATIGRGNTTPIAVSSVMIARAESPSLTSVAPNRTPVYPLGYPTGSSQTPTQGLQQFQQTIQIPQQTQFQVPQMSQQQVAPTQKVALTPLISNANLRYPDPSASRPDATPYNAPLFNTVPNSPSLVSKPYKTPIQLSSIQQFDGKNLVAAPLIDAGTQTLLGSGTPPPQNYETAFSAPTEGGGTLALKTNEERPTEKVEQEESKEEERPEETEDQILAQIKEKGFEIFSSLVENGKFKHFVARDTRGDIVVIVSDKEIEKVSDFGPTDLLVSKVNIPIVPTRLKQGSLTCASEAQSCKTAFICNDALCLFSLVDRKDQKIIVTEEVLVFQNTDSKLFGSK